MARLLGGAALLALLLATGCVAPTSQVGLPDGRKSYSVRCYGAGRMMGDCMNQAATICGSAGYTIIDEDIGSTRGAVRGEVTFECKAS